jgi:hypothetical protein
MTAAVMREGWGGGTQLGWMGPAEWDVDFLSLLRLEEICRHVCTYAAAQ